MTGKHHVPSNYQFGHVEYPVCEGADKGEFEAGRASIKFVLFEPVRFQEGYNLFVK